MAIIQNPQEQRNRQTGTGFTNLNKLIGINQNNKLGATIGSGLTQQIGQAKQGLGQANQAFQQESQKNRLDTEANKQQVQNVLADPTKATDQDVNAFQTFRGGRYEGPQALANQDKLASQAQSAQTLGNLGQTAGGRQALLQRFVGGAGYNAGKQRLDNLLLGQTAAAPLREGRREAGLLSKETGKAIEGASQQGQYLANQARSFGEDVTNQVAGKNQENLASVDTNVAATQAREDARSALYEQIRQGLAKGGVRENAQNLGDVRETDIENLNRIMGMASENNITQSGDSEKIQALINNLMTPAEKLYRRKTVNLGNDLGLGYGVGPSESGSTSSGGDIYSNLGIEEVLGNAFKTSGAENINRQGLASDIERSKASALARLGGNQSIFGENDPRYKASGGAFDLNQASSDVDREIARLKGESVEDLPTEYLDTSMEQKLRRSFAPTGQEAGEQVASDVGTLFSGDSSIGSKAGAWTRTAFSPYTTAAGIGAEVGKGTMGDVNQMLHGQGTKNKLVGGAKVVGQVYVAPVRAAKQVVNAVGSIFCYVSGTPIRMENGFYKNVDQLKLDDELYHGGKVTAIGHSRQDNMYSYMGTKVSGSHAVFENGKFIRVEDSKHGKKVDGRMDVYPIECEKHVMVTKTHISADFSEIDNGIGMDPEERLEILNKDSVKLKKLDADCELLFKNDNTQV